MAAEDLICRQLLLTKPPEADTLLHFETITCSLGHVCVWELGCCVYTRRLKKNTPVLRVTVGMAVEICLLLITHMLAKMAKGMLTIGSRPWCASLPHNRLSLALTACYCVLLNN